MHAIQRHGYLNFLKCYDRFTPLSLQEAPYDMKQFFFHNTNGVAMLVFSSFDTTELAINTLIKNTWLSTPPETEQEKTDVISTILGVVYQRTCAKNIIIAPNYILKEHKFIKKDDMTTFVCDLPEKSYISYIYAFIKNELRFYSLKHQFLSHFDTHHVTILMNLLLSKYSFNFNKSIFDVREGKWLMSQKDERTISFYNQSNQYSFSISRYDEDHFIDESESATINKLFDSDDKVEIMELLHNVFFQCFNSTSEQNVILSSLTIAQSIPDHFIDTLSRASIFEIKRKTLHLFGTDSTKIYGDAPFYEVLSISMQALHYFLLKTSYLGYLPSPQFAHYQLHFDKCLEHEISLYVSIGRMVTLSLYDKYTSCPKILNENMIKALFIFTKKDLNIDDDISYEKLKAQVEWKERTPLGIYQDQIDKMAQEALDKLTPGRRNKIAQTLFLLFPKILYEHTFSKTEISKKKKIINEKVITSILLHKKSIFIEHAKQVIMIMEEIIEQYGISAPDRVIAYLKKGHFNKGKLLDEMLREAKAHIITTIECVYCSFIEPLFLIAWSTYLYSKMQYTSLGNKKNSYSNQLHAYISMVGQYDNYFDAISLQSLPFFLKELQNEEGIFDVLGDPFDTKVINKLKETITGFDAYYTLNDKDIDEMIIALEPTPIVQQKRDWICEYLKEASSEEREWFFKLYTNVPNVDPSEVFIHVSGSSKLSNSRIIYSNSCFNNLIVGLTYHIKDHDGETPHYFFDNINDIKQIFPDVDVTKKAKECFLQDLFESIEEYKNIITSRMIEVVTNVSNGPFIAPRKYKNLTKIPCPVDLN